MTDAVIVNVSSRHGPARIDLVGNHDFNLGPTARRVEGSERPVGRAQITVDAVRIHESTSHGAAVVDGLCARARAAVWGIERGDGAAGTAHEAVLVVLRIEVIPRGVTRLIDCNNQGSQVADHWDVNRRDHTQGVSNKSVVDAAGIDIIPCHVAREVDSQSNRALLAARPGLGNIDRRKNLRRSSPAARHAGRATSTSHLDAAKQPNQERGQCGRSPMLSTTEIFRLPDVSVHGALHASGDSLGTKSEVDYTQDY